MVANQTIDWPHHFSKIGIIYLLTNPVNVLIENMKKQERSGIAMGISPFGWDGKDKSINSSHLVSVAVIPINVSIHKSE